MAAVTWRAQHIAVDWGTSNRRAWLIDGSGNIAGQFADGLGLMSVPENGFEEAVAGIRDTLGNWPMLLAGMVGSDKGWRRAPYVDCPADAVKLAHKITWLDEGHTGIVPGVCQRNGHADVMRGEEVQAMGVVAQAQVLPDGYICHPGTHTKWIRLNQGQIVGFRTMMTGEIFNLLRTESILAHQMTGNVTDGTAFQNGLDAVHKGASLLSGLFAVRANYLLEQSLVADASFASGLLIGTDVQAGLLEASPHEAITIVGRADLCQLYARAIAQAGHASQIFDGDSAFLAGIRAITQYLDTV